jgi:hypothetical protein
MTRWQKNIFICTTAYKSPDILLKMEQLAEFRMDSITMKKYAEEFATQASNQPLYGNMYNKYLIGLYAGVLNDPAKL